VVDNSVSLLRLFIIVQEGKKRIGDMCLQFPSLNPTYQR